MNIAIQFANGNGAGDWLPFVFFGWLLVWLFNLALVLRRPDYDPITRLTWVIVLIFVPVFGLLLYWFVAPDSRTRTRPVTDVSGTPWEKEASSR